MSHEVLPTQDQGSAASTFAKFTAIEGRAKGRRYKVEKTATIGRSPEATIMLEDPEVSRIHAAVHRTENNGFEIVDLKSRNGTYVNGQRITEPKLLVYGDKVRVGPNTMLEYHGFDAAEEQIIQRERFEAIGRLSIGIAHDLNNVLAALDAGTSYLRDLSHDEPMGKQETRDCLSDMSLASARAAELTRAILSYVRGSGRHHQPVDISNLVLEIIRMLRHTLDHSIVIQTKVIPGIFVHGNRSELHQALLNLCLNARDAMPNGGKLSVRVELHFTPTEYPGRSEHQPAVTITIRDSGVGMDAMTQSRIFEPFFTTKREGRGYGLGLATVREIATMHGGQVAVESTPGTGTEFTLLLPALLGCESSIPASEQRGPSATVRPPPAYSVLLVDDEEIVRRSMARRMRQVGFEVIEAQCGADAISLYQQHHFDLVLLDFDMPDLDGEQTFAKLRTLSPRLKVAFMSGYSDPSRAVRLKLQGAVATLEKPCSLDALLELTRVMPGEPGADEDFETLTRPQ